ncbi:MAG: ATP-binding protein [Verrucomicrobiales bacterium]|nr:ATP-binding protein [Verrucomicrobiales bacterium]
MCPWARLTATLFSIAVLSWSTQADVTAPSSVQASEEVNFLIDSWKTSQGLPVNWIECICQTRDGYLWLGTPTGLIRFDGFKPVRWNSQNCAAFRSDVVKALAEDNEGNLWVATKGGVVRLRLNGADAFTVAEGLGGNETSSLSPSRLGGMWIGTDSGVSLYREGRCKNYVIDHLPHRFIYSVLEDSRGTVWIGTIVGLQKLDPRTGQCTVVWKSDGLHPESEAGIVRCILEDREGQIWFGTDHSVFRLQDGQWRQFALGKSGPEHRVKRLLEDREGRYWAIIGNVLHMRKGDRFEPMDLELGLADAVVNGLFEDREGNLWVGSRYGGLTRLRPTPLRVFTKKDGLPHNSVRSVCPSRQGGVWVATAGGASQLNTGRFTLLATSSALAQQSARAAFETSHTDLWLATAEKGVLFLSKGANGYVHFRPVALGARIHALFETDQGEVWMSDGESLDRLVPMQGALRSSPSGEEFFYRYGKRFRYMPGKIARFDVRYATTWWEYASGSLSVYESDGRSTYRAGEFPPLENEPWDAILPKGELSNFDVRAILQDREEDLWFATWGGGVNRFRDNQFSVLTTKDGLSSDFITSVFEDAEGVVWLGTTKGINRFKHGTFAAITARHGLPSEEVNSILEDDLGFFWVSCEEGIYRVARRELSEIADGRAATVDALLFDESDSLLASTTDGPSQPAVCKTRDGYLWFATTHGLVRIDPTRARRNDLIPPVQIEQLNANGLAIDVGRWTRGSNPKSQIIKHQLRLPPDSGRSLEFHYTALSFAAPEKVRFRYRLEGLDKDWIDAGPRRVAFYTGLRPGAYRFQVIAANQHGVWDENGAAFAFTITPHAHQTLWFRVACGAGLASILWFGLRWRLRIHRLEHNAALAHERERIARDMHDDIGSRLNQIALLSDIDERAGPKDALPVADLARDAARSLNEIVWAVHPGKDRLDYLVEFISQFAHEYLSAAGLNLRINFPDKIPPWPLTSEQRHNLFLAAKEALCNVVKHAHATDVELRLRVHPSEWILEIADDGCGIPAGPICEAEHAGQWPSGRNGLENLRRRAESAGGELRITSGAGHGTKISFVVPHG